MLKTLKQLIQLVNAANDFQEALDIMVRGVRNALETESVSLYLFNKQHQEFLLSATIGLNPERVGDLRIPYGQGLISYVADRKEPINLADATSHAHYLKVPNLKEEAFKAFLATPILYHREILGVIVAEQTEARRFGDAEEALLITLIAQLSRFIAHAKSSGEVDRLFGIEAAVQNTMLTGIPGVLGVGVGKGLVIYPLADIDAVPNLQTDDIDGEIIRFEAALQAVRDEMVLLGKRLSPSLPKEEQELFDAYLRMLDPASLGDDVIAEIKEGNWAQGALRKVVKRYVGRFEAMDNDYMRERSADVLDIARRILSHLQSEDRKKIEYPKRTILVGDEVSAADLAEVPENQLVGIVSGSGSRSSHVAILANALGIPTVMGVTQLSLSQLDGEELVVDGYYGQVYVAPSAQIKQEFSRLADEESQLDKALEALHHQPAQTQDGHNVKLYVNTGLESDISTALSAGAEGVGLYRSEIPFLKRDRFPSGEEQRVIYRQLLGAFSPRPVIMRTLDVGGDKALSYFPIEEVNPFLGWRGVRISIDHPDIFLIQMRAMLRASEGLDNLQIMFPMVSDLTELGEALRLFEKAYEEVLSEDYKIVRPKIGAMIEVPSAVYQAYGMAQKVDFLSVGSNDLTQYLLAVDRNNAYVAGLYDWLHPTVLAALLHVVRSAHKAGKTASVCGEMAADPVAVVLLMAMGFDVLSMHANGLLRMKWVIRKFTLAQAKALLNEVMQMEDVVRIRKFLEKELEKMGLGGLVRAGR